MQEPKPETTEKKQDTKFKKGQSGNPNGRPKGSFSLIEMLRRKIQKECPDDTDKKTYAEQLIKSLLDKAIKDGDHATQKLLLNYLEGMPKQSLDMTSKGEKITGFNYDFNNPNNQTDPEATPSVEEDTRQ